jgi:hypothetical protein
VAGNMTVQAAAATVTANNQIMTSGTAVPALTFATTPSNLTFSTAPTCMTTATSSSTAGSYPITCSAGVAPNYNLNYTGGTMTVLAAQTIPNGLPAITSLSPLNAASGSQNIVETVTGSGFVSGATVLWNGSALTTTFVSATQLTATILAADLATVGTADVTVSNPAPGGGVSASLTFSIDSGPQAQGAFTVTPSSSSLSVTHGQTVTTPLTFSSLPGNAVVSPICYNLPAGGYCSFSAGILTIGTGANTPAGAYQVLVVCTTSGYESVAGMRAHTTVLCCLLGFPVGLLVLYRGRKLRSYGLSVLSILLLAVLIGCGGSTQSQNAPVVPAQASTVIALTVK